MNVPMINSATLLGCTLGVGCTTINVNQGGTGIVSVTPNSIICTNSTSTGPLQCTTAGSWSEILMSQGNDIPIWTNTIGPYV